MTNNKKLSPDYLTTEDAAKLLGVERTTVWRWGHDGKLNRYALAGDPRVIRYKRAEVEALAVANTTFVRERKPRTRTTRGNPNTRRANA